MWYVYTIRSVNSPEQDYVGCTTVSAMTLATAGKEKTEQ
jgi:hypothetical protein